MSNEQAYDVFMMFSILRLTWVSQAKQIKTKTYLHFCVGVCSFAYEGTYNKLILKKKNNTKFMRNYDILYAFKSKAS